ncbi:MAG: hypothetical protein LC790_21090 [Actinobacteria bacterium]|nr:hypothetical protein [Actinomycetota bacterium]
MSLRKWQRNTIFEEIQAAGFSPQDFELRRGDDETTLDHRWSESYFVVRVALPYYEGEHAAGDGPPWPYKAYGWEALPEHLRRWLRDVRNNLETPDLWAELLSEREMLGVAPEGDENTPFTRDEQGEIAKRLREVEEYVKATYSLSEGQAHALRARLDYLETAAGRLGRTDWRGVFVGVVVSLGADASFGPSADA